MPRISVIIPIYNSERYLDNLISCINAQTYTDYEVIFINDGSTDNSREILQKYCDNSDNKILVNKENGGVSSARNLGLQMAKGELIAFWDADDDISPHFLQEMILNFEQDKLLFCGFNYRKDDLFAIKLFNGEQKVELDKNSIKALQDTWLFNVLWNKIFEKDIILKNHIVFDEEVAFGEDTLFVTKYLNYVKNIVVINKPLYTYYTRSSNASSKYHSNLFSTNVKIYENIILSMDETKENYQDKITEIRKVYAVSLIGSLWHYCKFIKKDGAKRILKQSLIKYNKNALKITPKINLILKLALKLKWVWFIRLYYKIFVKR